MFRRFVGKRAVASAVILAVSLFAFAATASPALDASKANLDKAAGNLARLVIEFEAAKDAKVHKEIADKAQAVLNTVEPETEKGVTDVEEVKQLAAYRLQVLEPVVKRWKKIGPVAPKAVATAPAGAAPAANHGRIDCPKGSKPFEKPDEAYCASVDSKKQGPWLFWYSDGKKKAESNWKDGKRQGFRRTWSPGGQMREEEQFANDELSGASRKWSDAGVVVEELRYKNGKKNGVSAWWFDNGKSKEAVTWNDGKREGHSKRFHPNGKMADDAHYKDGQLDGPRTQWTPDGTLVSAACYRADRETWRTEDPNKVKERPCK